jgi:hypothetical protein
MKPEDLEPNEFRFLFRTPGGSGACLGKVKLQHTGQYVASIDGKHECEANDAADAMLRSMRAWFGLHQSEYRHPDEVQGGAHIHAGLSHFKVCGLTEGEVRAKLEEAVKLHHFREG